MKDSNFTKAILLNQPEQVQKYVKNYLPNNPETLQKIYNDLANFNITINEIIQGKIKMSDILSNQTTNKIQISKEKNFAKSKNNPLKHHSSHSELFKKKADEYFERKKQQNITKRQQALIRTLKQKGLRGKTQQIPIGLQIIKKEDRKISKPLQINKMTEINQNKRSSLKKCIDRFNLNKDFYMNTIKDGQIDTQKYYDKQMKRFLDSRSASLKKINAKEEYKNQIKHNNAKRYSHVDSVILSKIKGIPQTQTFKISSNLGIETMTPQKKIKNKNILQFSNRKSLETQNLINTCRNELKNQQYDDRPKSLLSESKNYETLRQKSQSISKLMQQMKQRLQFDGMQLENNSLQIDQMAKQYSKTKLIDKYTLNYLKVILSKHSNETVLANRKDLLKNQIKFRKILIDK